jgi:hypothetical protein
MRVAALNEIADRSAHRGRRRRGRGPRREVGDRSRRSCSPHLARRPTPADGENYIAGYLGRRFDQTVNPWPYVKARRSLLRNGEYGRRPGSGRRSSAAARA